MRLTKFGHSCLLVEEGNARLLFDPGMFSAGFEELQGLTAVLLTHAHADHLDEGRLRQLLERDPGVRVISDEGSAEQLGAGGASVEVVHDGDELDVGGVNVRVFGTMHAVIHPDIPNIPNVGYLVNRRLFHPGDAFTVPTDPVEILAVPASAPWLKVSESIDYVRALRPRLAVPVHDKVLSSAGAGLTFRLIDQLGAGDTTKLEVLEDAKPVEV
jgi:L-ascorbate metabolism protein UlaG (beta-lactamase superfamily)